MANRVLFKKSSVAARVPLSADLEYGEIAINYADEKIYIKNSSNAIKSFNAGASVSSVALSLPAIFTVSGSPVTTSGTLTATLASQTANTILAAPNGAAGTPTFRVLASGDLPATYSPAGTLTLGTAGQTTTMLGNISAITSNQTITLSPTGTGTITVNPAVAGNINNMNIGATTRGTGAFTTLGANNTVTISTATNNQTYSTTGAGTITISSGTAGSIDNMTIGGTTPAVGTFSQLLTPTSAVSSAAWTTNGINLKLPARTYTDTTSIAGTIPSSYANVIATPAFASTNAITITDAVNLYVAPPTGGANSTLTNLWALYAGGRVRATDFTGTIGATTAGAGAFTTLSASSTISGTGFSTYLASPPAIGGTAAAAGAFTTLSASSTVSGTGFSTYLASPPAIGGTAAAAGSFTNLTYTGTLTGPTGILNIPIASSTAPAALGVAAVGTGTTFARADHVHLLPTLATLGAQAAGSYLTSAVTTISGGTTGLTPATATSGAVTLAGTLAVANGGTGRTNTNPKLIGSFTVAAADTNWWRVAAMDTSNQPRYAKFLIVTTNHLNIEITFSNGAGGDYGHVEVRVRGYFLYWLTYPSFIRYNPTGTNLPSYVEIQLPLTGGTGNTFTVYELENFSLSNAWVTYPMATTGVATDAGTKLQFFSNTAILRRDGYIGNGYTKEITIPTGTTGQSLISNGSAVPSWITLTLMNIPGAWSKKACDAATTVALTLNTAQVTIDGITLSATSRVLVKNQAAPAQNGIYTGVTTTLWVRDIDADTSGEIAGATVSVDAGTVNFGQLWTNNFQPTDTLGTTAMNWYRLLDTSMTGVGFNSLMGYGTTVSSATALVLTKASGYLQYVTGSTAQVITLPDVTTLTLGWSYQITNNNTANNITINSSGANLVYTLIPGITVMITCILITGTTAASWNYEDGGAIITNDIATSTNIYPLCAAATSGSAVTVYTSNTKYLYKPSTGELSSPEVIATNGLVLNSSTISSSYTVAAGTNAMSVGPITVNSGVVITVSPGQRWVVL